MYKLVTLLTSRSFIHINILVLNLGLF